MHRQVGIPYRVLILPRGPAACFYLQKIVAFARSGGIVIATAVAGHGSGLMHAEEDSHVSRNCRIRCFRAASLPRIFLRTKTQLGADLAKYAAPDMTLSPRTPEIGFIHRKLSGGDLYFVANTANEARQVRAQFRNAARHAEAWDAFTGRLWAFPIRRISTRSGSLRIAPDLLLR